MNEVDFIIIGQGLAGTAMAFRLLEEGKRILIVDEGLEHSASKVSSGILNPITGRRYVKSWKFEELLPEALSFYNSVEKILGISIIESKKIYRGLENVLEENLWYSQSAKPDYEKYFGEGVHKGGILDHFKNELKLGEIQNSYRVDLRKFMTASESYFREQGIYLQKKVTMDDIEIGERIVLGDYKADAIIFAEGYQVLDNPLFGDLGFRPFKGEILICEIDDYEITHIVKNKKFIVPIGENRYWVGSTIQKEFIDLESEMDKRQELIEWLDAYLNRPYRIIETWTGVRPATKFRKPLIGQHPSLNKVFLFNGLGTKGATLGPYYSRQLKENILYGKELDDEVNIARFNS